MAAYERQFGLVLQPQDNMSALAHHGIRGQKWGVSNGPPYPLKGGDYSKKELTELHKARRSKNSIYNKKHFDTVLKANKTTLRTLSYNKDRTKNTDMFYAASTFFDKKQYDALFNKPIPKTMTDENGKSLGSGVYCKYAIDNKLAKDINVASEDSGAKIFGDLFKKNRDFYNFVVDDDRMTSYFDNSRYKFQGYREARDSLNKLKAGNMIDDDDIKKIYRMFNYVIPYDGKGNARAQKDMAFQRAKFFSAAKKAGYGALLDINDAIYGGFKAQQPVIMFDLDSVIPDKIKQTTIASKAFSSMVTVANKLRVHT